MQSPEEQIEHWKECANTERARAQRLEQSLGRINQAIMALETKVYRGRIDIQAPAYVATLLRDLAALALDAQRFDTGDREWLARVARTTAAMLERHRRP